MAKVLLNESNSPIMNSRDFKNHAAIEAVASKLGLTKAGSDLLLPTELQAEIPSIEIEARGLVQYRQAKEKMTAYWVTLFKKGGTNFALLGKFSFKQGEKVQISVAQRTDSTGKPMFINEDTNRPAYQVTILSEQPEMDVNIEADAALKTV